LFISLQAQAIHTDIENRNYTQPALIGLGAISGAFLISEMENGPTIFATLYSMGTLYLMREWYRDEQELTDLVVPFGLLTMAVLNAALFTDEDDVFIYNIAGAGLLTAYAMWEHAQMTPGQRRRKNQSNQVEIWPLIRPHTTGFLITGITF
jgi:hypothetical protein